jgi:predicted GIY-YIG superfamily endonuclease
MEVYALGDPRTSQMRYIGIAKNVYRRYAQHLVEPHHNKNKNEWIEEMKKAGHIPTLTILESGLTNAMARKQEQYWIQHYIGLGAPLTNIHHGKNAVADKEVSKETSSDVYNYISASVAAQILSEKCGFPVDPEYISRLAKSKKQPVRTHSVSGHKLYRREDIEAAIVKKKRQKEYAQHG